MPARLRGAEYICTISHTSQSPQWHRSVDNVVVFIRQVTLCYSDMPCLLLCELAWLTRAHLQLHSRELAAPLKSRHKQTQQQREPDSCLQLELHLAERAKLVLHGIATPSIRETSHKRQQPTKNTQDYLEAAVPSADILLLLLTAGSL